MCCNLCFSYFFFLNGTATTEIYTLSLHDALPISDDRVDDDLRSGLFIDTGGIAAEDHRRSEEHTSELQSRGHLVCRLRLEKQKDRCDRGVGEKDHKAHRRALGARRQA